MASVTTETKHLTTEELLALPDDGVRRWLINGELREGEMTVRNWIHSAIMVKLSFALEQWRQQLTGPRGVALCGESGIKISANPDSTVGVDVAYISPEVMAQQSGKSALIEGVPTLVVEILSPSSKLSDINEKIDLYLSAGVPLVWTIDPMRRTATVYRPNTPDRLVTENESLSGEDVLSGLSIPLKQLFE
jgi:Uma2 family endonuclease